MADIFGSHAGYILAAYLAGFVILGFMVLSAWLSHRVARIRLARLEGHNTPYRA